VFRASTVVVTPDSQLTSDFDMAERTATATPRDTIKGMFFPRVEAMITARDPSWRTTEHVSFRDYPLTDYFRLVSTAAQLTHPDVPFSEAVRRIAGADFSAFANTRVGRISLAFMGDALTTLDQSDYLYNIVLKGQAHIVSEREGDVVTIRYRSYPGPVEAYPLGTIESTLRHFGKGWRITIEHLAPLDANYTIEVQPSPSQTARA